MTDIKGIVLVIIDALRKDVYDHLVENKLLDNIGRLGSKALLFDNAYALVNATDPSLTTILTGKHPLSHGIIHHGVNITQRERIRAENLVLLSEYLSGKGWFTAAVDFLGRWHRKGFLRYSHRESRSLIIMKYLLRTLVKDKFRTYSRNLLIERGNSPYSNPYLDADIVTNQTIKYLSYALKRSKKFFILTHYWSTHIPYFTNRKFFEEMKRLIGRKIKVNVDNKSLREVLDFIGNMEWRRYLSKWFDTMNYNTVYDVVASYYAAVKYVDHSFGKIIEFLEDKGILDQTLIIVTGDHGESLGEHDIYFDHHGLYQVSLRVPLIFYIESLGKDVRKEIVMHTDIVPTIMNLLNEKYPSTTDGVSLINDIKEDRAVVSIETHTEEKIAVIHDSYKLIESISRKSAVCRYCGIIHGGLKELYNLGNDPLEKNNIYDEELAITRKLKRILAKSKIKFRTLLIKYKNS